MLPQTYSRTQRAKRLYREFQTLAVATSFPATAVSPAISSSLSNSSATPLSQRETRRGHYVVKRRWWLPHIPDLDDVKNYPYNEHERGSYCSCRLYSMKRSGLDKPVIETLGRRREEMMGVTVSRLEKKTLTMLWKSLCLCKSLKRKIESA